MRIIIVGGGSSGAKTAAKCVRDIPDAYVLLITKSRTVSYSGGGLAFFVENTVDEDGDYATYTPDSFEQLTGVAVMAEKEVISVDACAKNVLLRDMKNDGEETIAFDKLVIATGAEYRKPDVPGANLPGVVTVNSMEEAVALREMLSPEMKRVLILGGEPFAMELAGAIRKVGPKVVLTCERESIVAGYDAEFVEYIESKLPGQGIILFGENPVSELTGAGRVEKVLTPKREIKTNLVVIADNLFPNTEFLDGSGVQKEADGSIATDDTMKTNLDGIYAVGSCAQIKSYFGGTVRAAVESNGNVGAYLCALALAGKKRQFRGVLGTKLQKTPGLMWGRTGLSTEEAEKTYGAVCSATALVYDKTVYMKDVGTFCIRAVAERESRKLIGLQAIGTQSVEKLIDTAATAISLGADIDSLTDLDLAFSADMETPTPAFLNAMRVLGNKMDGRMDSVNGKGMELIDDAMVFDISNLHSYKAGKHMPISKLHESTEGIHADKTIVLVCGRGKCSYMAQNLLKRKGISNTVTLEGGIMMYPGMSE